MAKFVSQRRYISEPKRSSGTIALFIDRDCIEGPRAGSKPVWPCIDSLSVRPGAINMVGVGIAIATAGIIVGAVGSTGLSTNLIIVIETIARDNVIILILLTIILCLLLGMGLPTTANYTPERSNNSGK